MRKLQINFSNRMKWISSLALVALAIMLLLVNPFIGIGAIIIAIAPMALTDQEQALVDHIKSQFEIELGKVSKGYISEEKALSNIDEKIKSFESKIDEEKLKQLKNDFDEKLKAQWQAVESKLKETEKKEKLSFSDRLKAAFAEKNLLKSYTDEYGREVEEVALPSQRGMHTSIKAAFDMNTAGTTASVDTGYQTNYGMMMQELPLSRDMHLTNVFPHMPLAPIERYMAKVVEYEETDGTAIKTETTAAGDSSYKLKTVDFKVFDYGVKFRVHRNMLKTWTGLQSRIQAIGVDRLMSKFSTYILDAAASGDGSTVPYGLGSTGYFTAYDTTLRANLVQAANIVDVIANGILQVALTEKDVDSILLNPVDIAALKSLKDGNDNKIAQAGLVVNERGELSYIHGLRIVNTKKVTANTFWLVNTTSNPSVEIGDKWNMELIMGYDKTEDLSKGIVTIQLESEFAVGLGDTETIIYCSDITSASVDLSIPNAQS